MSLFVFSSTEVEGEVLASLADTFVLSWEEEEPRDFTFLDTFDWRLFRAGLTLSSFRKGSRRFLHLRAEEAEPWEVRVRRVPAFAMELPEGPVKERTLSATWVRRLLPRASLHLHRRTAALLNEDTKTVVRIRTTSGEAVGPDSRESKPLPTTLEILPLKGYEEEAQEVRGFLWRSFGLRPVRKRLLTLAMEAHGDQPGVDPSDPDFALSREMTAREGARAIHRALLDVIRRNEAGVVQDLDPEFLHDFRVAIRRTRSALGQIKNVLPLKAAQHFAREFKWLGGRTGPTRDMDVYLLKIPDYKAALPGGVQDELVPLVHFLEKKKRVEHQRLVRSLRTKRYQTLLEDWSRFLEEGQADRGTAPDAGLPLLSVASGRIWKLYKKVLKSGAGAQDDTPAEVLHRLRIQCKRLRYVMTFFASLYPEKELKPLIKTLKGLQDNLGDFNDLHVQQLALRKFADEMLETGVGPPETLMAMGRLMGQLETQQEAERIAFAERFRDFSRPRNLKRFERLFKIG